MRIHWGSGRFCFAFFPKIFFTLKVLLDGCGGENVSVSPSSSRRLARAPPPARLGLATLHAISSLSPSTPRALDDVDARKHRERNDTSFPPRIVRVQPSRAPPRARISPAPPPRSRPRARILLATEDARRANRRARRRRERTTRERDARFDRSFASRARTMMSCV
jgi:hypothetical protein